MSKINRESYLDAVRKLKTQSTQDIGRFLNKDRSSVFRFKDKNPKVVEEGNLILEEFSKQDEKNVWSSKINTWEYFNNLPCIVQWTQKCKDNFVGDSKMFDYARSFWYVCKHLKVHPDKVDIELVAELVKEAKRKYYAGESMPRGLAYTRIREGVRSFYSIQKRISLEHITTLGVTKEASLGQGRYAKQKVTESVRHRLEDEINALDKLTDTEKFEAIYADKFMYYTSTRVTSTLEFCFSERPYHLEKDVWEFTVLDKGERGGKEWDKELIGFALDDFKNYCSKRFNIPIDKLETELPRKTDHLFPSFIKKNKNGEIIANDGKLGDINRECLIKAGLPYKKFPPNHIWRHTFAQDGLESTDMNYDLVAELGGWDSSDTLRRHYGKINKSAKRRGLREMMGLPKIDVKRELRW